MSYLNFCWPFGSGTSYLIPYKFFLASTSLHDYRWQQCLQAMFQFGSSAGLMYVLLTWFSPTRSYFPHDDQLLVLSFFLEFVMLAARVKQRRCWFQSDALHEPNELARSLSLWITFPFLSCLNCWTQLYNEQWCSCIHSSYSLGHRIFAKSALSSDCYFFWMITVAGGEHSPDLNFYCRYYFRKCYLNSVSDKHMTRHMLAE